MTTSYLEKKANGTAEQGFRHTLAWTALVVLAASCDLSILKGGLDDGYWASQEMMRLEWKSEDAKMHTKKATLDQQPN